MAQFNITLDSDLLHGLFTGDGKDQAFSKLLETILNQVLLCQSKEQLGAAPYERTENRTAYRNGFREREMTTRVGTLTLRIPRHRDGEFATEMFERYQRSEQALILCMMEMVINGVSTRKVTQITEELCGKDFSKSTVSELCKNLDPIVEAFRNHPLLMNYPFVLVDAIYIKVRELGKVKSKALQIAVGINEEGKREIIGLTVAQSETEKSWQDFFESLKERGLKDPNLLTSDNHAGLVKAVQKVFTTSLWQRCQTHFSRNVLDKTPKTYQSQAKEDLRTIYEAVDRESAQRAKDSFLDKYSKIAPKAVTLLEEAFEDITESPSFALTLSKTSKNNQRS